MKTKWFAAANAAGKARAKVSTLFRMPGRDFETVPVSLAAILRKLVAEKGIGLDVPFQIEGQNGQGADKVNCLPKGKGKGKP